MSRRRNRDRDGQVAALRQPQPDILSPLWDLTGRQIAMIGAAILAVGLASLLLVG
jgi:hypothetical protein